MGLRLGARRLPLGAASLEQRPDCLALGARAEAGRARGLGRRQRWRLGGARLGLRGSRSPLGRRRASRGGRGTRLGRARARAGLLARAGGFGLPGRREGFSCCQQRECTVGTWLGATVGRGGAAACQRRGAAGARRGAAAGCGAGWGGEASAFLRRSFALSFCFLVSRGGGISDTGRDFAVHFPAGATWPGRPRRHAPLGGLPLAAGLALHWDRAGAAGLARTGGAAAPGQVGGARSGRRGETWAGSGRGPRSCARGRGGGHGERPRRSFWSARGIRARAPAHAPRAGRVSPSDWPDSAR
jgi:hypothetical protein